MLAEQPSALLTLEEKGPIAPPPKLATMFQDVARTIQSWPGLVAATHWLSTDPTKVDGADFYVGKDELGHIHLNGECHVATTKPMQKALLHHDLAGRFPWDTSWSTFRMVTPEDARQGLWLFRLAYDRINGTPPDELLASIAAGPPRNALQ